MISPFNSPVFRYRASLAAIILVASWLRLAGLTDESYWNDELATLVLTDPDKKLLYVLFDTLNDRSPPLYQTLLWAWFGQFGFSELSGRLFSALIGILGVPAIYFMARGYMNREGAIYAALITSLNYYHIFYSQEVRSYGLLFLLAALCCGFLSRLIRNNDLSSLLTFTFLTTCLVQTHYYGLLVYLALFSCLILYRLTYDGQPRLSGNYLVVNAMITLFSVLPVAPFIVINAMDDSFWINQPGPDFIINYFTDYFDGRIIAAVYALLFFAGLYFIFRQKELYKRTVLYLTISILIFVYLIPWSRGLYSTPMIVDRYTIGGLPLIIMIVATGLALIKQKVLKGAAIILVIILNIHVLFFDKNYYRNTDKQQYREIIQHVIGTGDEIPLYACKSERVEKYFKMLGRPVRINDDDKLLLQITHDAAPASFRYIGATCCGCDGEAAEILSLSDNSGFEVVDRRDEKGAFILLFSRNK